MSIYTPNMAVGAIFTEINSLKTKILYEIKLTCFEILIIRVNFFLHKKAVLLGFSTMMEASDKTTIVAQYFWLLKTISKVESLSH